MFRIGIDVGGTFTDLVAVDDAGRVALAKAPSTPRDPALGVLDGLGRLAAVLGLDRPALLAVLKDLVSDGGLIVTDQGQPVTESERLHELLVQALDAELKALALHTMLRA